jgi:hypothetical protein
LEFGDETVEAGFIPGQHGATFASMEFGDGGVDLHPGQVGCEPGFGGD